VTGYKLTESAITPLSGDAGWTAIAPSEYSFSSEGIKTLYAWAKDAAGNVSLSLSTQILISTSANIKSLGNTDIYTSNSI
jgi:hypothetical protein